jgi:hypothetical protein
VLHKWFIDPVVHLRETRDMFEQVSDQVSLALATAVQKLREDKLGVFKVSI